MLPIPAQRGRDVPFRVHLVSPGRLGQFRPEHRRLIVADQCAETRTEGRDRIRARRLQLQNLHSQRIAGLRILDEERTGLRIRRVELDNYSGGAEKLDGKEQQRIAAHVGA